MPDKSVKWQAQDPLQASRGAFVLSGPSGASKPDDQGPIVVLAGWVGCQDRYLSKFSALLTEAGYTTVRGTCPTAAIFFPTQHLRRKWTQDMLDFVDAVDPSRQRQIVLWAFSNGGAFPVVQIHRLVHGNDRYSHFKSRIQGVIFDSAPCYMHAATGATALGEGQPAVVRLLAAALFYLIMLVMMLANPSAPTKFWDDMTHLDLGRASLYLYSDDDHLCDAVKLEQLIAARRAAGRAVVEKRWRRSRHVAHLRAHPEEYRQAVLEFLGGLQPAAGTRSQ